MCIQLPECGCSIMECSISPVQAKEELESWGLRFAPELVQLSGRKVNPEKIMFRKNTIVVNEEADWGREAVKERVLSAVS